MYRAISSGVYGNNISTPRNKVAQWIASCTYTQRKGAQGHKGGQGGGLLQRKYHLKLSQRNYHSLTSLLLGPLMVYFMLLRKLLPFITS